jgi:hypothetical protein
MPELAPAVLGALIDRATAAVDAVVLLEGAAIRPFPAVLRVAPAAAAAASRLGGGDRSVVGLLRSLRAAALDEAAWRALDPSGRTLRDIDVPDDLNR